MLCDYRGIGLADGCLPTLARLPCQPGSCASGMSRGRGRSEASAPNICSKIIRASAIILRKVSRRVSDVKEWRLNSKMAERAGTRFALLTG